MDIDISDVKSLGDFVIKTRKEQGLSQEDLAGLANTGKRFISDLENGKETVQYSKVVSVLVALGFSLCATNKWISYVSNKF